MNIENKKQIAIIMLAIGLGLVASVLTAYYVNKSIGEERKKLSDKIAKDKIEPLKKEILTLKKEVKLLASRPVTTQVVQQQEKPKTPALPKSSLALRTPAGKRAYTVRIDALSAVGGLVNPGDYVDVLAELRIPAQGQKTKRPATLIIFQNIQILAVGANLRATGSYAEQIKARALNVTFGLTPEECSLMTFVQKNGKIQLVLRAPSETETEILQTANWSALADYVFEKQGTELVIPRAETAIKPVTPTKKEEVKPFIEIYQGGSKSK